MASITSFELSTAANSLRQLTREFLSQEVIKNFRRGVRGEMCWAAAKPGRSERGQNKAARPAAKNLDREVGRPKHRRTAKCTASPKTDGHFGGQTKSAKRKIFKYYIQISEL
ncbi:hypothetical protein BpHYR1_021449 [Brachionus plicatilis]|uniref:Uncharacterized protein n=1 Tax=Brachionus plicatilis TaxID=10195 RepID=A0A3M7SUB3_BRAPC|nr:hypothetical protein BpHYR1_021449 [Brachionus plicatilis]